MPSLLPWKTAWCTSTPASCHGSTPTQQTATIGPSSCLLSLPLLHTATIGPSTCLLSLPLLRTRPRIHVPVQTLLVAAGVLVGWVLPVLNSMCGASEAWFMSFDLCCRSLAHSFSLTSACAGCNANSANPCNTFYVYGRQVQAQHRHHRWCAGLPRNALHVGGPDAVDELAQEGHFLESE